MVSLPVGMFHGTRNLASDSSRGMFVICHQSISLSFRLLTGDNSTAICGLGKRVCAQSARGKQATKSSPRWVFYILCIQLRAYPISDHWQEKSKNFPKEITKNS